MRVAVSDTSSFNRPHHLGFGYDILMQMPMHIQSIPRPHTLGVNWNMGHYETVLGLHDVSSYVVEVREIVLELEDIVIPFY